MIFNYLYGGIKIVTITINGAPGEKVTLTPTKTVLNTIEVTLNDKGVYTGEVSKDKYTFVGEVSKEIVSSLTYEVEDGGVYNLWGAKRAIFWYGKEVEAFSFAHYIDGTEGNAYNTGKALYAGSYEKNADTYDTDILYAITTSTINTSQYSTLKMIIEPTYFQKQGADGYSRFYYGYTGTRSDAESAVKNLTSYKNTVESRQQISITSPKTNVYIGIGTIANNSGYAGTHGAEGYCYAIWLE